MPTWLILIYLYKVVCFVLMSVCPVDFVNRVLKMLQNHMEMEWENNFDLNFFENT